MSAPCQLVCSVTPGPGRVVVHREVVISRDRQPGPALLDLYMAARRVTTIQVTQGLYSHSHSYGQGIKHDTELN